MKELINELEAKAILVAHLKQNRYNIQAAKTWNSLYCQFQNEKTSRLKMHSIKLHHLTCPVDTYIWTYEQLPKKFN